MHLASPPCVSTEIVRLLSTLVLAGAVAAQADTAPADLTTRLTAQVHASKKHGKLPYRLFTPRSTPVRAKPAQPATSGPYPLVLFLHGAGERGTDNRAQLRHGVREFVLPEHQRRWPCFVLAPQSPRGRWWDAGQVIEFLRAVLDAHPVDRDRVYVTGLSMGGNGTWQLLAKAPELLAAAVPICGWGDVTAAGAMAKVPIWAFHGAADTVVEPKRTRVMIEALRRLGAAPKSTEYPGVRHDSWTRTYRDPAVHTWLFAQVRPSRVEPTALKSGDRVAFLGDSITAAGARGDGYIRLIEADLQRRRPDQQITLIGAGISGHKVPDLRKRLERDVLSKQPSIVVIYIGINDVWHWNRDRGTRTTDFESGLRDLIARIGKAGARVVLCTPSVIGEKTDGSNRFDQMLDCYAALSRKVARDTGTQLLDLRRRFLDHLAEHNPDNRPRGVLTRDSVHLNKAGNRFVADCMLRALGMAPRRIF